MKTRIAEDKIDFPLRSEILNLRSLIGVCFVFSGATGLIYEVLWARMLGLVFGATTLAVARRLGAHGEYVGVDISEPMIAAARARAERDGSPATFIRADAQTHPFEPSSYDAIMSRFGVMFFDDPEAAFANIRKGVRKDGTLTFIAWRSPMENPFMITAVQAAAPFLPAMTPPDPNAPGQFAFADGAKVRRILEASGWRDVDVAPLDLPSEVAEADLMAYVTKLGPAGAALRDADDALKARVSGALETAFRPYVQDGAARFTSACWLVTARA